MPLTPEETDFLVHLAFEYTNILPGPAFHQFTVWGLRYLPDYHWLLGAYIGHLHRLGAFDGNVPRPTGRVPPIPWTAAEVVRTRNAELEAEVQTVRREAGSS